MALDYYYDGQMRRYYLQFVRIFSGFKYASGTDSTGQPILRTVPAKLALQNRQVGHILRNNSENTLQATPQITCAQTSISVARDRTQTPNHVSKVQVTEREFDSIVGKYGSGIGNSYTVERYMAVPYDLTMQVDIWTSNEHQKHQIMEQIMMLFNPSIDLQTGTNLLDWTALTIVEIQDITWSSRSIAIGVSDEIEISTITFKMPIWISPPAKVQQQRIIQQVITNIQTMEAAEGITECGNEDSLYWSNTDMLSRIITTPGGHMVRVEGSEIILLGAHGATHNDAGKLHNWTELLEQYGDVRVGVSQLRLKTNPDMDDHASDIVGVFEVHPLEPNKLLWVMDMTSLPANTLGNIDGIVEAHRMWPGNGLPDAAEGQRYLLLDNVVGKSVAWGQLDADAGDIIQRVGDNWTVMFRGRDNHGAHYVLNARSGKQLKWDGTDWVLSVDGDYHAGFWRLFL